MAPTKIFWLIVTLTIFHLTTAKKISEKHHFHCPSDCHCTKNETNGNVKLHCINADFITKLTTKELSFVTSLDLSSSKMHSLDHKIKKLKNLEYLDLSMNRLKDLKHFPHFTKLTHLNLRKNMIENFSGKHLPGTLVNLDIAFNHIKELPEDIIRLQFLRNLDISGNQFSCNENSLNTRDNLVEQKVNISGIAMCMDPPKLKGKSWLHAIEFDEFFKLHPDEQMLGDEPEGSGDVLSSEASGDGPLIIEETTTQIEIEEIPIRKIVDTKLNLELTSTTEKEIPTTESDFDFGDVGSGDDAIGGASKSAVESSTLPERVKVNPATAETDKHANLGTHIFLGIFLICLLFLLIYAVKKNREKKREQRKKKRTEALKQRAAAIELMPKNQDQRKPNDKQNGNTDTVPFMNGQNGNSKPSDDPTLRDAEEGLISNTEPLLSEEPPQNEETPLYSQDNVKSVKVKASEIPESIPQTPILINKKRSSDGKTMVVSSK